jgi:hypothetical protein
MFKHEFFESKLIEQVNEDGKRFYRTPIGDLSSVTTVLKRVSNTKYLDDWRKSVGQAKADAISLAATNRGNAIHKMAEQYLLNEGLVGSYTNKEMFNTIRSSLDNLVEIVYGLEFMLYSKELMAAGTADLVARIKDRGNAVCDFKTAKRLVKLDGDTLQGYRYQVTAYSIMLEELYGIEFPYCCIFLMTDGEPARVVVFKNEQYRNQVKKIFKTA